MDIGVCTWSIDREDCLRAMETIGGALDVRLVQLGFFSERAVRAAADGVEEVRRAAKDAGLTIASTFAAFEHEDYASIPRIAASGGYLPDEHYAIRLELTGAVAEVTAALGCDRLAVHLGTVPEESSPDYATLTVRVREVADCLAERRVRLLAETGRESAASLEAFLTTVNRPNIAVNFDPGNFVIYGTDEPARAVTTLKGRIDSVHAKDGSRSARPGVAFGKPAPLGTGEAQIARVVSKLRATGYAGPLLIELSRGMGGVEAVRGAVDYLRSLLC